MNDYAISTEDISYRKYVSVLDTKMAYVDVGNGDPWEKYDPGGIEIKRFPAADWRGDEQASWVVEHDGRRIIHCGDTI
jgi:L-ascorbate metabolism protein UlaG (beta-lactamase superfamily)